MATMYYDDAADLALGEVGHATRERLADRQPFGVGFGIEQPQHRINMDQFSPELPSLAFVHRDHAGDLRPLVAERVDSDRLFVW